MDGNQLLKARLKELAQTSFKQNRYTFTRFLRPEELSVLDELTNELPNAGLTIFGGYECCERQMVRFGSLEMLGYEEAFPITLFQINPLSPKFTEHLEHKDYLGALMHLGIEREMIGDILILKNTAYAFCVTEMYDYIVTNLEKIKHTNVTVQKMEQLPPALKPRLVPMEILVASERFDAVIAALCKLSRTKAQELFRDKKILLNGRVCENNSLLLKEGLRFSAREYGKYIYQGISASTKKGKIYVQLMQYQTN